MNCLGLFFIRSSGKGKKQVSLHYTAAQLLEKGVLVEIEDLPTSQYVSLEGRMSGPNLGGGWGNSGLGTGWEGRSVVPALKELLRWGRQAAPDRERRAVGVAWHSSRHPKAQDAGKASWKRKQPEQRAEVC